MSSKEQFLKDWFQDVWWNENASAIHEMFVPDAGDPSAHGLQKDDAIGPNEFEAFHKTLLALVTKVKIDLHFTMEKGDWISARCTLSAVSRKDPEKKAVAEGSIYARITDNKVREAYNYLDFLHFFEALGYLPDNTLATCLSGEKVAWKRHAIAGV